MPLRRRTIAFPRREALASLAGLMGMGFLGCSSKPTNTAAGGSAATGGSPAADGGLDAAGGPPDGAVVDAGPNPDLSWTATVDGPAKGAQSGFIAPVVMYDGSRRHGARVYPMFAAGTVDFYVERVLGETGAISTMVMVFASTNTKAGTHFSAVTQTITYADGQIGWQKVSIPILAIPEGFGIVGIRMTGNAYREYSYIWLQGKGYAPGAFYLRSLGAGVDATGNTSGDGSAANPWRSPAHAAATIGDAGGVLYVSSAGGSFVEKVARDFTGMFMFTNKCSPASPIVVVSDPANTTRPIFDNGETNGLSNAQGINFGDYCTSVWCVGLHVLHGNFTTQYSAGTHCQDCVIWQCEAEQAKYSGSNSAGARLDHSTGFIVDNCKIHEIYSTESGSTSNSYTSVPSGFEEGVQHFDADALSVVHCDFDLLEFGVFQKNAPLDNGLSMDVSHCLFRRFQRNSGGGGGPIAYEVAGAGSPAMFNAVVRYNAREGGLETAVTSGAFVYCPMGGAKAQSSLVDVFGNTVRKSSSLFEADTTNHIRIFDNISEDEKTTEITLTTPTTYATSLEYTDYNLYVRGPHTWLTHYGGGTVTYGSLAAWQAASEGFVANSPDVHSIATSTTPLYANAAAFDYRWTAGPTGRGGRPIGVGDESVGVTENYGMFGT